MLVTCVSRLAPEKGIPALLEAWELLKPVRGTAKLAVVGSGLLEERLRRERPDGVHYTGALHGAELSAAYASADIFALPSTTETFGNVLLEAMASGVACVAMGIGGVTEFAIHGENCLLADPTDPGALARHLRILLEDRLARQRLAASARATAATRNWPAVLDQLLLTYTSYTLRRAAAA